MNTTIAAAAADTVALVDALTPRAEARGIKVDRYPGSANFHIGDGTIVFLIWPVAERDDRYHEPFGLISVSHPTGDTRSVTVGTAVQTVVDAYLAIDA